MNILIVTEVFYPEDFVVNDLAAELKRRGHTISVLTRQPSYPQGHVYPGYTNAEYSKENWNGICIHRISILEGYRESKVKKLQNYYHFVKLGNKTIDKVLDGVDVIFVSQTGPLSVALPAIYAKQRHKIPVVVWTLDIWPDHVYMYGFPRIPPVSTLVNHIIRKVYSNADKILISSKRFADSIHHYFPGKELIYMPNWVVKVKQEETNLNLDTKYVHFVFTGNVSHAQNIGNTIKGFVQANIQNAMLDIVGDGTTLDENKKLAKEMKCKNVVFHGRIPYPQVQSVLKKADYLVLPLTSKGGIDKTEPYKIQSYLMSGKPIFGIIKGSGRDIIQENELGYCADPDDVNQIAEGFRKMMTINAEELIRIQTSSIKLMKTRFCRESIIDRAEAVLQELCEKKQAMDYENDRRKTV